MLDHISIKRKERQLSGGHLRCPATQNHSTPATNPTPMRGFCLGGADRGGASSLVRGSSPDGEVSTHLRLAAAGNVLIRRGRLTGPGVLLLPLPPGPSPPAPSPPGSSVSGIYFIYDALRLKTHHYTLPMYISFRATQEDPRFRKGCAPRRAGIFASVRCRYGAKVVKIRLRRRKISVGGSNSYPKSFLKQLFPKKTPYMLEMENSDEAMKIVCASSPR